MSVFSVCLFMLLTVTVVHSQTSLPFKINGPKSLNDRIAIVGGGPAGVHMALLLKEKGFTNVVILERSSRLGGKSLTINRRGAPQEMGTVYLAPDYHDLVIPLVNKYVGKDELRDLPAASIWLDNSNQGMPFKNYILKESMRLSGTTQVNEAVKKCLEAMQKYVKIHTDLFGVYEGEIMLEPSAETFHKIRGTFMQFLKRNDIEIVASLFYASHTVQGYGRIDEIPTLYGLMWNTPRMVGALLKRVKASDGETGFYMLKHGFSNLWEQIVKKEKLRVHYKVDIERIYRPKNGNHGVWVQTRDRKCKSNHHCNRHHWKKYDFMIWSPEMKTSLQYWDAFNDETFYFSRTRPVWFTTALVDTKNATKGSDPVDYWFDNINLKRQDVIWAQRDSYPALRNCIGTKYQAGNCTAGDDGLDMRTSITYQMSDRPPYRKELLSNLKKALKKINASYIRIHRLETWRYFPKYSTAEIEKGYLWRILEMQGKHSMWYIGSSTNFESIKSVIDYNALIMKNYDVPSK